MAENILLEMANAEPMLIPFPGLGQPAFAEPLTAKYTELADDKSAGADARDATTLICCAESELEADKGNEAKDSVKKALALFRQSSDSHGVADALRLFVRVCLWREHRSEALQKAKESLTLFQEQGFEFGQARMLLSIAEAHCDRRGGLIEDEALRSAQKALDLFRSQGDRTMEGYTLLALANIHIKSSTLLNMQTKMARHSAMEARKLFQAIGEKRGEAMAVQRLKDVAVASGQTEEIKKLSDILLSLWREVGDRRMEAFEQCMQKMQEYPEEALSLAVDVGKSLGGFALSKVVQSLGSEADHQRDFIMFQAQEGLQRFRVAGDKVGEAYAHNVLVYANWLVNNMEEAINEAEKAREMFKDLGKKRSEAYVVRTVSMMQAMIGNSEGALKQGQIALSMVKALQDGYEEAVTLKGLAGLHLHFNHPNIVLKIAKTARVLFQIEDDKRGEASLLIFASNARVLKGQQKEAIALADDALDLLAQQGDRAGQAHVFSQVCKLHTSSGNLLRALEAAGEAQTLFSAVGDSKSEANMMLAIAKLALRSAVVEEAAGDMAEHKHRRQQAVDYANNILALVEGEAEDITVGGTTGAGAHLVLAEVYMLTRNDADAEEEATNAAFVFSKMGDLKGEASALDLNLRLFARGGKAQEAQNAAKRAIDLFMQLGDTASVKEVQEVVASMSGPGAGIDLGAIEATPIAIKAKKKEEKKVKVPKAPGEKFDLSKGINYDTISSRLYEACVELLPDEDDELEYDVPLMQAGITSSSTIMLQSVLAEDFPSISLPNTMAFDYPTVNEMTKFILDKLGA